MTTTLSAEDIRNLVAGELADPFSVLGVHPLTLNTESGVVVRTFLPGALTVTVLDLIPDREIQAHMIDTHGLFEVVFPDVTKILPYRLKVDFGTGFPSTFYDCYSFGPVLTEYDLFLFNQGFHGIDSADNISIFTFRQ